MSTAFAADSSLSTSHPFSRKNLLAAHKANPNHAIAVCIHGKSDVFYVDITLKAALALAKKDPSEGELEIRVGFSCIYIDSAC